MAWLGMAGQQGEGEEEMQVTFTAKGTRSLLMHNVRLASPMDPYAKELSRLNKSKRSSTRTDEDRLEIARVEWEGGFYFDDTIGPYVPGKWVFKTLLEAARSGRRGKKIEGGVLVMDDRHPLIYPGPRIMKEMWGDNGTSEFVDFQTVRVGQAKVDRCRPVFRQWAFEAKLMLDTSVIDAEEVADIARIAGQLIGIGDYRQQYGRFDAEVVRV